MNRKRFTDVIAIETYGVSIAVWTTSGYAIEPIRRMLAEHFPNPFKDVDVSETQHEFYYVWNRTERDSLFDSTGPILTRIDRPRLLDSLGSKMRLIVAEFAVDRVFLHAGVVGWKGNGIVIPAESFSGKTTLVAELIKLGAEYYSDEYAVLDPAGMIEPYAKKLSLRGELDKYTQIDRSATDLGGTIGKSLLSPRLIVLSQFQPGASWKPVVSNAGSGLMELIKNAVSIRRDPERCLSVLGRVSNTAIFVSSPRGEAVETAPKIIEFVEQIAEAAAGETHEAVPFDPTTPV